MSIRVGLLCVLTAGCSLSDVVGAGAMPGSGSGGGSSGVGTDDGGGTSVGSSGVGTGTSGSTGEGSTGEGAGTGTGTGTGTAASGTSADPEGCSAVDLLLVVNTGLGDDEYVDLLEMLSGDFLGALWDALPPGTGVHVGVTLSDFSDGMGCTRTVKDCVIQQSPAEIAMAYLTPDQVTTSVPGGQGRLLEHQMLRYYTTTTDADPAGASMWLAGLLGGLGTTCPLSMTAAGAGWAVDPINDATNTGFVRDDAVLAILLLDEGPDATPEDPQVLISKVTDAKPGCTDCIVAGGLVGTCVPAVGDALWGVLQGLFPGGLIADVNAPQDFEQMLTDVFPMTVAATCALATVPG